MKREAYIPIIEAGIIPDQSSVPSGIQQLYLGNVSLQYLPRDYAMSFGDGLLAGEAKPDNLPLPPIAAAAFPQIKRREGEDTNGGGDTPKGSGDTPKEVNIADHKGHNPTTVYRPGGPKHCDTCGQP